MKIYRAELQDGGGPFYHRDGTPRDSNMPAFKDSKVLYGADSIEHLNELITNYGFDINNFIIKIYESDNIISRNKKNGHIIFIEG